MTKSIPKYLVIAAILQIVWGLVPSASQFVIQEIPVEIYIALRWSISGLIFGIYLGLTKTWKNISLKDFCAVSTLGIVGYGIASLGTLYGLKLGGAVNFALMSSLSPLITAGVAILALNEKPTRLFYVALPISILGLALLVLGKYEVSSLEVAGMSTLFILGGYLLEALVFVSSKIVQARVHVVQYLAIAQLSAATIMWLLQAAHFHQISQLANFTAQGIIAALFVSVVACVLCYAVLYWLLNHIPGHKLALFDGIHALSATFFGYLIFRDPLKPIMLVGGALILSGMIVGNSSISNPTQADPT